MPSKNLIRVLYLCEAVIWAMSKRTPHVIFYTFWALTMVLILTSELP